jgi:aspartate racemase
MEKNTKILGVLGGMGPAAGVEFLRLLTVGAPAQRDQEHPVVYMISDPQIPDRTEAFTGKGPDPTEHLQKRLETLCGWGVDLLAVPCNTAHIFIDRFRGQLPAPFIHIVEETTAACQRQSPKGAWLLATEGTRQSGLYQNYAQKVGYSFREVPVETQISVTRALVLVKAGQLAESGECMREIAARLWDIEDMDIATACTELPLAYDASGLAQERSVSSLGALADACLNQIYGSLYNRKY